MIEGLCHQCHRYVPACNGKKKNNYMLWYRHAHKVCLQFQKRVLFVFLISSLFIQSAIYTISRRVQSKRIQENYQSPLLLPLLYTLLRLHLIQVLTTHNLHLFLPFLCTYHSFLRLLIHPKYNNSSTKVHTHNII